MRVLVRLLAYVVVLVLIAGAALAAFLHSIYGGGKRYADLTTEPLLPASALETIVISPEPIGNLAASAEGRLFYTIHPESGPTGPKLYEWAGGRAVPFPAMEIQNKYLETPLGLRIDGQHRLWIIDHGSHGTGLPRLIAVDLLSGEVAHEHSFANDIAPLGSFLQDLTVDQKGETVYIADVSYWRREPAIVIYDVKSGTARRVLQRHASVSFQDWQIVTRTRPMTFFGGLLSLKVGIDGIALDARDEWLYYAAMSHDKLFRIRTSDLLNAALAPAALAAKIEDMGPKPLNDGITTDTAGSVYITDVEHGAVMRREPDGTLATLIKVPEKIRWADALGFGPQGWLYIADSAIPDQMLQSKEHMKARAPYFIYRVNAGVDGIPGR